MKNYVADSYCIITYFEKDKGYEKVIELFCKASNSEINLYINLINWGEVYYIILREQGFKMADLFENNFKKLSIEIVSPDMAMIKTASEYKAFNSLSYANCISAADAKKYEGILITGDKEFTQLEKEIYAEWI
ncbi:MAG: PIN domain-containing protein [Candidatus Humimicrobiaceae bacterium]